MSSKFKSPISFKEDTGEIPFTRIEAICKYKFCDNKFFICRCNTPGPTTYYPKVPRKHTASADFTTLAPRKLDVVSTNSVGPSSYDTHWHKAIKPTLKTHNVKLKQEAAVQKSFRKSSKGKLRDYIYSHHFRRSLLTTFIDPIPDGEFVCLEMLKEGSEIILVRPGEREKVVAMRKILIESRPKTPTQYFGPPLF